MSTYSGMAGIKDIIMFFRLEKGQQIHNTYHFDLIPNIYVCFWFIYMYISARNRVYACQEIVSPWHPYIHELFKWLLMRGHSIAPPSFKIRLLLWDVYFCLLMYEYNLDFWTIAWLSKGTIQADCINCF